MGFVARAREEVQGEARGLENLEGVAGGHVDGFERSRTTPWTFVAGRSRTPFC